MTFYYHKIFAQIRIDKINFIKNNNKTYGKTTRKTLCKKVEQEHGIATISFSPTNNSLPAGILEELAHEIHTEGLNPASKLIVLRSSGEKAFIAGCIVR